MAEIDLIPVEYRTQRAQRSLLRRFAVVMVALTVLAAGAYVYLLKAIGSSNRTADDLRARNAITQQQQDQLQVELDQKAEYLRQWSLLRGLRAGAAVEDIFQIIDRAIVAGDLWFVDWGFRRAGVIIAGDENTVSTGYFIVVAADGQPRNSAGVEVETHMSIKGQARDHQALSTFVRGLFEQPLVKDVSVQRTSQSVFAGGTVVDFTMTVILNSTSRGA